MDEALKDTGIRVVHYARRTEDDWDYQERTRQIRKKPRNTWSEEDWGIDRAAGIDVTDRSMIAQNVRAGHNTNAITIETLDYSSAIAIPKQQATLVKQRLEALQKQLGLDKPSTPPRP